MRRCPNCGEPHDDPTRRHCDYCEWPLDDDEDFEASRADYLNDLEKEDRP